MHPRISPRSAAFVLLASAFLAIPFFTPACTTGADGKKHFDKAKFEAAWNSPATQEAKRFATSAALNIGVSALSQLLTGQPVDLKADALSGAANALRTTIGTNAPMAVVHQTIADGISDPALKKPVADAITGVVAEAIKKHLPPDVAKEAAAQGLDLSVAAAPAVVTQP